MADLERGRLIITDSWRYPHPTADLLPYVLSNTFNFVDSMTRTGMQGNAIWQPYWQ